MLARRADEVLGAAWTEFELKGAGSLWRIPPVRTKNKREIVVPLSAPALSIIERRTVTQRKRDHRRTCFAGPLSIGISR